jgi:RHS repeat-associated protein
MDSLAGSPHPAGSTYGGMVYDAFGQLMEYNDGRAETQDFMWLQGRPFATYVSGTRFLHPNALGSTAVLTDQQGTETQDELYYPWGGRWAAVGTVEDERFAAMQKRDAETSLDPTPNRMYRPLLGRWLSPDPLAGDILNPQSLNRYAYALNNPTTLTDPLGACPNPPQGKMWGDPVHCTHPVPVHCTSMDCADRYFGGSLFEGYVGWTGTGVCVKNGVAGYCGSDMFDSVILNGNDIFDAIAGAPGTYLAVDTRGNLGFGFSEELWSQTWGFIDTAREQGFANVATSGYGVYQLWVGAQSAAFGSMADAVAASQTGFVNSLNATLDAAKLANPSGPYGVCGSGLCQVQVTPGSPDGSGNLTIGVVLNVPSATTIPAFSVPVGPTKTWPFP